LVKLPTFKKLKNKTEYKTRKKRKIKRKKRKNKNKKKENKKKVLPSFLPPPPLFSSQLFLSH